MKLSILSLFVLISLCSHAQTIHSHNDYRHKKPFWEAYLCGAGSIEVDVYMSDGEIVVCHDRMEAKNAPTLKDLYIEPMAGLGAELRNFILNVELKDAKAMAPLMELLERYPDIFRRGMVEVVVSGKRPGPSGFHEYPDFIWFDGHPGIKYTAEQLRRIWMISLPLTSLTSWKGKRELREAERRKLREFIASVHASGAKIRFWRTGDNEATWLTLHSLGADLINTDKPAACTAFFLKQDSGEYKGNVFKTCK